MFRKKKKDSEYKDSLKKIEKLDYLKDKNESEIDGHLNVSKESLNFSDAEWIDLNVASGNESPGNTDINNFSHQGRLLHHDDQSSQIFDASKTNSLVTNSGASAGTSSGESLDCDPTAVVEEVNELRKQQQLLEVTGSLLGSTEVAEVPNAAKKLIHQNQGLVSENARLHGDLLEARTVSRKKVEEAAKSTRALREMHKENERLSAEVTMLQNQAKDTSKKTKQTQDLFEAMVSESEKNKQQAEASSKEAKHLQYLLDTAVAQSEKKAQEAEASSKKVKELQNLLEATIAENEKKIQETLMAKENQLRTFQAKNTDLIEQLQQLRIQVSNENGDAQNQITKVTKQNQGLQSELQSVRMENAQVLMENKNYQKYINDLEKQNQSLHSELLSVRKENEKVVKCHKCPKLDERIESLTEKLSALLPETQSVKQLLKLILEELWGIDRALETLVAIELENRGSINPETLRSLTAMGFNSLKAQIALEKTENSLLEAIELLTMDLSARDHGRSDNLGEMLKTVLESIKSRIHTLHKTFNTEAQNQRRTLSNDHAEGKTITCSSIRPGHVAIFLPDAGNTGDMYALSTDPNCRYKLSEESKALIGQQGIDETFFNETIVLGFVVHVLHNDQDVSQSVDLNLDEQETPILHVVVAPITEEDFRI